MPDILSQGTVSFARKRWASGAAPPCSEALELCDSHEAMRAENERLTKELAEARKALNTPELHDFASGVISEAQHQRNRWGSDHDAGKKPLDWFWLLGYLGGKALSAHSKGDTEKALHHTVSSAAVLANWHAAILGQTNMRPGIDPVERGIDAEECDECSCALVHVAGGGVTALLCPQCNADSSVLESM